jgi:hypothetical protein
MERTRGPRTNKARACIMAVWLSGGDRRVTDGNGGNQMSKLNSVWQRVERIAIYVVILTLITLQLVASFVPKVEQVMDARGSVLLLATVFLFFFRYIDERIGGRKNTTLEIGENFTQGIVEMLGKNAKIESMDIFAQTGQKYLYALTDGGIKIKRLRILLRSFDQFETIRFPPDKEAKSLLKQELHTVIKSFRDMQKRRIIETLTIKYYPFDPSFFFLIADNRLLEFSLFQPVRTTQGVEVLNSFIAKSSTLEGAELVRDFRAFFEATFEDFALPAESSRNK